MCFFTPLKICREVKAQYSLQWMRAATQAGRELFQSSISCSKLHRNKGWDPRASPGLCPSVWYLTVKSIFLTHFWISWIVSHVWCLSSFCHITLDTSLAQPVLRLPIRQSNKYLWSLSAIFHLYVNPAHISPSFWMETMEDKVRGLTKVRGRQHHLLSPFPHSQPMKEGNAEGQDHLVHGNSTNDLLGLCVWEWFPAGSAV